MPGKIKYEKLEISKENPASSVNILSSLTFWWMNKILRVGNQRPIENEDLYPILSRYKTQVVTDELWDSWDQVQISGSQSWRLLWALIKMSPPSHYLFLATTGLIAAFCNMCQPVFLGVILSILLDLHEFNRNHLYIYAAALCFSSLIRVLVLHQFLYYGWLMAMRWRTATMGLVFNKIFRLSQTTLANTSTGYIINLVTGDVQRFDPVVSQIALFFQGLFEVVTVSALLAHVVGLQAVSGVIFLVLLVFYYCSMGRVCVHIRNKIAKVADKRLGFMNTIVTGIRTVKMYAWEGPFIDRLKCIRSREIRLLFHKGFILATFQSFLYTAQSIAAFISFVVLRATGVELNTFNIFMTLAFINAIRSAVAWNIAEGANYVGDFISALQRIQVFLELQELKPRRDYFVSLSPKSKRENTELNLNEAKTDSEKTDDSDYVFLGEDEGNTKNIHVCLDNVTCYWNGESSPSIQHVSLELKQKDLVLVTGPVGCGKTSLLSTILGELPVSEGRMLVRGNSIYVSQKPWVFSGTVRDNIIFGQKFKRSKYQSIIKACDLEKDISNFPNRDMTVIGERGVLLSGGQRTRIGLARALYVEADVYLLDDPLSAVDAKVGRHIFLECICGILSNKTRIIVTHQLQYLKGADHVVFMKSGSIFYEGTYEGLNAHTNSELQCIFAKYDDSPPLTKAMDTRRLSATLSFKEDEKKGLELAEEDRFNGSVSWRLYWDYLVYGFSPVLVVFLMIFFLVTQAVLILPDWWLLDISQLKAENRNKLYNLYIYGGLVVIAFMMSVCRAVLFFFATLNSSRNLHDSMAKCVLRAPVLFFDTNPTGRILNRFSRDIGVMDDLLPIVSLDAVQLMLFCVGAIILPSILNPIVIIAAVSMAIVFYLVGRYYLKTSRELRRLEALNRSPVFSHFSDTLEGLVTIRNHHMENKFIKQFYKYQDDHTRVWFTLLSSLRWLGLRLDLLCVCFTTAVVFAALAMGSAAGPLALSLIYALQLAVDTSQYGVRQCSETENYMTSVERVMTYTQLEQEPGYDIDVYASDDWPQNGQLELQNVSLEYYPEAGTILNNVSFKVKPQEKIGIAGRTGAGKSSIVSALFRMPDPRGIILIDKLNIKTINLQNSRSAMAVIAQDPVLFTGSLRFNLDPFDHHNDEEIWEAIDGASLRSTIENLPSKLDQTLKECGLNLSVGERQLLCLARALLQRSKIIVMDEATANVDFRTDSLIQETIRTKLKDCTVITIAHRLNTIMDYDKILVLENGRVVEYDTPQELLNKPHGVLRQLYYSHVSQTS